MGPLGGIGPTEIIIVLVIALLVLGPKRLPGLGKSLGTGMREFKESVSLKGTTATDGGESSEASSTRSDTAPLVGAGASRDA